MKLTGTIRRINRLDGRLFRAKIETPGGGYEAIEVVPEVVENVEYIPAELIESITDTWDEIIESTTDGTYTSKYCIGDTKLLDLGTEGQVLMEIVAFDTDILASDNTKTAAITWISKQLLVTSHRMNPANNNNTQGTGSIGGWEYSEMRSYLNNTIKPLIPSNVRSAIREVTKYSKIYNTSGSAVNNVSTGDDLWIPSAFEIGFPSYETSGVCYVSKYADNDSRIKTMVGGSANYYWTRSASDANRFGSVTSRGNPSVSTVATVTGVALGFCMGETHV